MSCAAWSWTVLTLLAGCASAFRPYVSDLLAGDATFEACREQMSLRYGRLAIADRPTFRLQSGWLPVQDAGRVTRRRATLFRGDDGHIQIVVEESVLHRVLFGDPEWTSPRSQPELAAELERAIEAALGA